VEPLRSVRPNALDWFFAVFLGVVAAAFVFPATCFGSFMLLGILDNFVVVGESSIAVLLGTFFLFSLGALCFVLPIFSALWLAKVYIKAVRKHSSSDPETLSKYKPPPWPGD